jgi:hypothetical protein
VNEIINARRSPEGGLRDFVNVPYLYGNNTIMAHLNTGYYHIHGQPFVRPNLASSTVLTAGAGAWDTSGAKTEVIPANSLNVSAFDLHWIVISAISENSEIQIDIYKGAALSEVLIGSVKAVRNAIQSQEGAVKVQVPQQEINTRISCRVSSSAAGATTCAVSFLGHYYA